MAANDIVQTSGEGRLLISIDTKSARASGAVDRDAVRVLKRLILGAGVNREELRRHGMRISEIVEIEQIDLRSPAGWERLKAASCG